MAYLGAIDLVVSKTVSILTINRLPASSLTAGDINVTTASVLSVGAIKSLSVKYGDNMGGITPVLTIPKVGTYYNKTLNNVSLTTVNDTVLTGNTSITTGQYSIINVGGPVVTWNTNAGSLGTFLTNSIVALTLSASTNTGGTLAYTVSVGTLPNNLTLSSSLGTITGTINNSIASTTSYTFTIRATENISGTYADQVFSMTEGVRDPYFSNVTLLLNSETTALNSQNVNNIFKDDSGAILNNLVPITYGNITQGSVSPFNTNNNAGWSTLFVRSNSDNVIVNTTNVFNFNGYTTFNSTQYGISDFTCEAWIFMNTMPTADTWPTNNTNTFVVMGHGTPATTDGFDCIIGATKIFVQANDVQYGGSISHGMTTNTWYHVAWVRINGTLSIYVNGTVVGTTTFTNANGGASATYIGSETGSFAFFDGYITNVRVIKNQGIYTGSPFTVPTSPLTFNTVGTSGANVASSLTGTVSLLTLQSRRYIDNSVNAFTVTVNAGAPKIVPNSPFITTGYYRTSSNGASGYFTGTTGDYVTLPAYDRLINWYTPSYWSCESWIYPLSYSISGQCPAMIGNMDPSGTNNSWSFGPFSDGTVRLTYYTGTQYIIGSTTTIPIGVWSHIAMVKTGNTILIYINGVLSGSGSIAAIPTFYLSTPLTIGQYNTTAWNGYIYNLRIVNSINNTYGFTVYPTAFTPATTALALPSATLIGAGTRLLTAQSATFVDNSSNSYTVYNGIIPFSGTYSYIFNGVTNQSINLSAPATHAFTGNFTIEFWAYVTDFATAPYFIDYRPAGVNGIYIALYANSTGNLIFYTNTAAQITTTMKVEIQTWTHVALVKSSNITRIFINGVVDEKTYSDTNSYLVGTARPIIGNGGNTSGNWLKGALSNYRISNTAIYTANFTPPTTALTSSASTVLLTAQATTIVDSSSYIYTITNNNVVVESGSLTIGNTIIPFANTYSLNLTGTRVSSVPYTTNFNLIDDFSIEFWIYYTAHATGGGIVSFGEAWQITWSAATNALFFSGNNSAVTLTSIATLPTTSTWYHVALTRVGTTMRFFINGTADTATTASVVAFSNTIRTPYLVIGYDKSLSYSTTGYISNLRFTNRKSLYQQNFPVPFSAATNLSNPNGTYLLTAQATTIVDNSSSSIVMQPTGFSITNSAIPFANTYSYMFNGTNSNVTTPGTTALDLNSDFTIELWFNANNAGLMSNGVLLSRGGLTATTFASYELIVSYGGVYFTGSSAGTAIDIGATSTLTGSLGLIGLFVPNTWNHVAVTRNGNIYRGYLNGALGYYQVLALTPVNVGTARGLAIGSNYVTTWGTPANISTAFSGYISNLRITKGSALYTNNFTPLTTALTNNSGLTSLLTFQSATLIDNSDLKLPLTASGYSFSSNIIPFNGTISTGLQNNTNFTGNLAVALNTSNFSLDFWSYPQSYTNSTNPGLFDTRTSAADTLGFGVYLSSTNVILKIGATATNILSTSNSLTPFVNTYSYSFTTNTYLTVPDNTAFQFGSGDFTIETWIYHLNFTAAQGIFDKAYQSAGGISMTAAITTGLISIYMSSATPVFTETGTVVINTWYHIAVTRNGNNLRFFRNGTQIGSTVVLTTQVVTAAVIEGIGANNVSVTPANYFNGYISNLRVVKGFSAYVSNFAPPTTALVNTIQTIPYITASTYYGTFNGSSQYLTITGNANLVLTGDFTIEMWIYGSSTRGIAPIILARNANYTDSNNVYISYRHTNSPNTISLHKSGAGTPFFASSIIVTDNIWYHVALVRNGSGTNNCTMYINGSSAGSYTDTGTYDYTNPVIGTNPSDTGLSIAQLAFGGYISNLRIVKGTPLYTSTFTPSGPLTNITNTNLLVLQSSSITTDNSSNNFTISNPNSATTALGYYGSSSLLILQSATIIDNATANAGVGFTITNSATPVTITSPTGFYSLNSWNHIALIKNSGNIYSYLNGVLKNTLADASTFSNTKFFVGSTWDPFYFQGYINNLRLVTGMPMIGNNIVASGSTPFTPATSNTAITGSTVQLLTAQSATIIDTSINGLSISNANTVTAGNSIIPFANTYSFQFNGTNYLTPSSTTSFSLLTYDFTIEAFVYLTSYTSTANGSVIFGTTNGAQTGYYLWVSGDGSTINFTSNATGSWVNNLSATTAQLALNTWYHLAVSRQGATMTLWRNGISIATAATFVASSFSSPSNAAYIGYFFDGTTTKNFTGYISNLRVTKGLSLYNALFTVPVSALTTTSNTSIVVPAATNFFNPQNPHTNNTLILMLQTASYADNSLYTNPLLPSNATPIAINSVIPYTATYSFDFLGANAASYMSVPPNAGFDFAFTNTTVEFWVYPRFVDSLDGAIISVGSNIGSPTWRLTGTILGALSFIGAVTITTPNNTLIFNSWNHISISRLNYTYSIFVNGVSKVSGYSVTAPINQPKFLYVGYGYSAATKYQSYLISNLRITAGTNTNVNSGGFVPPTTNLSLVNGTTFLLGNTYGAGVTSTLGYPTNLVATANSALFSSNVIPFANTYSWSWNAAPTWTWPGYIVGTGQFTIDLFFYNTTNTWTNIGLLGGANNSLNCYLLTQTSIGVGLTGVSNLSFTVPSMIQNTWYHLAVVKDGNNLCTVYLNGIRSSSGALSNALNYTVATTTIGAVTGLTSFTGYLSNVRFVAGADSALYDVTATSITIPTSALPTASNTQILTCQDPSPIDNSSNNAVITIANTLPMISARAPFANTNSVFFNGVTPNYLTVATNIATAFGANDFTIEGWFYFMNSTANAIQILYANYATTYAANTMFFGKHTTNSGYVGLWIYNYSSGAPLVVETSYPANKTWVHYAAVRVGNTFTIYRNGTATATSSGVFTGFATLNTNVNYIGSELVNFYQGYISNFRIVNGTGVYTNTFTPSVTPLTAITNTVLLTCQTDQIIDRSPASLVITNGHVTSGTQIVPFSGAYSYYLGNSTYLSSSTTNTAAYALSGSKLTVESWFYIAVNTAVIQTIISASNGTTNAWALQVNAALTGLIIAGAGLSATYNYNFAVGNWYHVVWTNDLVAHRFYINGYLIGAALSTTWTDQTTIYLGWLGTATSNPLNGYVSNARIVKGFVLYNQATFTPSTTALTNNSNATTLLTAQSATLVDNSGLNSLLLNAGSGTVTAGNSVIPFANTYSYSFNGTSTMLSTHAAAQAVASTFDLLNDFTIEFWFYSNATYGSTTYTSATLLNRGGGLNVAWPSYAITLWGNSIYFGASSNNDGFDIGGEPGAYIRSTIPAGNTGPVNSVGLLGTFTINTWYHVAISRNNSVYRGYLNGTNTWTQGGLTPYTATSRGLNIGATFGGNLLQNLNFTPIWGGNINSKTINTYGFFNGYISNLRINNGVGLYTSNFTPATSALATSTTTANTMLLTAQSSTAIDNSVITNKFILGGPTYSTNSVIPFANTYSHSLLGTYDNVGSSGYLTVFSPNLSLPGTTTSAFTIELWVYPIIQPIGAQLISQWLAGGTIPIVISFTTLLGSPGGNGNYISFGYYNGSSWLTTPATTPLELFKWTHIAAVYDGTYASLYLNGVLNGVVTTAWTVSSIGSAQLLIGKRWDLTGTVNNCFQGFISNLRYVKGQALYSANFTPPTGAVTATNNTQLLMNFDNASIVDVSAKNALQVFGNPTISPVSKYGTSSIAFNRNDVASYLQIPATSQLVFTGDFTIESWIYLKSLPATNVYPGAYWIFGTGATGAAAGTDLFVGSTLLNFNLTTTATPEISIAHGMVINTWYHIAICRSGTNLRAYVSGVLKQTATASTASSISGSAVVIGRSDVSGASIVNSSGGFDGYIDDLRITKYARYTSTTTPTAFTPPTGQLPIG